MAQKLRMLIKDKRPWFDLALTSAWGLVLAVAVLFINTRFLPVMDQIPDFLLTTVSLAQTILSTLAGALLTITTFTFSTTMVVLTTYSSNFSPRVVENFLQEKTTMKVLGTFIGGFVYSILTLFFLGEVFISDRVLSASVAILYAIWCVIQFVVFIFSVGNSVQAQHLIARLYEDARGIIEEFIDSNQSRRLDQWTIEPFTAQARIVAASSGYLVALDIPGIRQALANRDFRLVIARQIGDFISKGDELGLLLTNGMDTDSDEVLEEIRRQVSFSSKRFTITDYRYAIQKIVDIALRAISPGINDPNTAISCIHSLELLTGRLSTIEGNYQILTDDAGKAETAEIILENYNFDRDLQTTFGQLVHYGKEDLSIVLALLDAMAGAIIQSTPANRDHLLNMARYIADSCRPCFALPADQRRIEAHLQRIFRRS